jgi:hypothetical protein
MSDNEGFKSFLFISESDAESAKSRLKVSGVPYVKKMLESGPNNWVKIIEIIKSDEISGVLVKLTHSTMRRMLSPEYKVVARGLLSGLESLPNIVFVHSSFFGIEAEVQPPKEGEEEDHWFGYDLNHKVYALDERERTEISKLFADFDLNIIPYRRNVELNLLAGDFVESHQSNLLFRFYVPSGKIYAEQTVDILTLFRDYLTKSFNLRVRQSMNATGRGTVYEFFGDGSMSQEDVAGKFEKFTEVMDLCLVDPESAEKMLVEQGADAQQVSRLVTDYSKKLRRINSDIGQERERKVLDIRHRLESELLELASEADLSSIRALVDKIIPKAEDLNSILSLGSARSVSGSASSITMNFQPQFISHVQGIVAQEITGNQHFGPEPMQLLEIIRQNGSCKSVELISAVHELEDTGSTPEKRASAGRRLQAFLGKVGEGLLGVSFGVLQSYIESKIGIP